MIHKNTPVACRVPHRRLKGRPDIRRIFTGQQKILFSKLFWIFYILLSGMMSSTRCWLQISPKPNIFPVIVCWNFKNCIFSRSDILLHWPKNFVYIKEKLWSYNILWSGIWSIPRFSHQIFPRPHNFPEILCWNFENSNFLLFI